MTLHAVAVTAALYLCLWRHRGGCSGTGFAATYYPSGPWALRNGRIGLARLRSMPRAPLSDMASDKMSEIRHLP